MKLNIQVIKAQKRSMGDFGSDMKPTSTTKFVGG